MRDAAFWLLKNKELNLGILVTYSEICSNAQSFWKSGPKDKEFHDDTRQWALNCLINLSLDSNKLTCQ